MYRKNYILYTIVTVICIWLDIDNFFSFPQTLLFTERNKKCEDYLFNSSIYYMWTIIIQEKENIYGHILYTINTYMKNSFLVQMLKKLCNISNIRDVWNSNVLLKFDWLKVFLVCRRWDICNF